ncbi:MAG TPA: class I SAM-dependent methyltransferase [Trebonia sp.]
MPESRGTGPGAITPDGCAVELYARLPAGREPGVVHAAAGDGASILELGCGAGRVTHSLIGLGHAVTAVDESQEMLARVRSAETVCARIEDLDLDGRRFGAVLLCSHLLNAPFDSLVRAWLATCRRHVAPGGCVLIEHHPPAWFDTVADTEYARDGITFRLRGVTRPEPGYVSGTVEYAVPDTDGGLLWTQAFAARRLDEETLRRLLGEADLAFGGYLTEDHAWLRAVPV